MGKPSYFDKDFAKMDREQRARYDLGVACKTALKMIEQPHQLHTALGVVREAVKNIDQHLSKK